MTLASLPGPPSLAGRGRKRALGTAGPGSAASTNTAFSAAAFGVAVCKRLRSAREALRHGIVEGGASGSARSAASGAMAVPKATGRSPAEAASVGSSFGAYQVASMPPPQPAQAHQWSRTAARASSLPPASLAQGLSRPLLPPVAALQPRLPQGGEPLWQVSAASGRASVAVPLSSWEVTQPSEVGRSRSCPLGYLEYQNWLQRVVPAAELRRPPEEKSEAEVAVEDEGLSGLELLRRLCAAAVPEPPPRRSAVPRLTPEEMAIADDSLYGDGSPNDVLASRFSVDLTRGQLQCLQPRTWLNDEVINFYFKLLQERSNKAVKAPTCWFTNSFFWNKLSGGPAKSNDEYSYKDVRRWTTKAKVDIFALDYVIFPMNIGEMHWAMGAIDFKERGFRYFDSMISRPHPNFVPFLRRYICDEHKSKKNAPLADADSWGLLTMDPPVPQQSNGYDCGVFTCFFADYFSAGRKLEFSQDDMQDLRVRLTARVVKADENWDTC